jgi:hypothetical protein
MLSWHSPVIRRSVVRVSKNAKRLLLVFAVGVVAVVVALALAWRAAYRAANLSETLMVLTDVSGADVEVIYTNSDTLAKQEDISVYLSDAHDRGSWIRKSLHGKTRVFSYDPGNPDNPPPSITSPAVGQLLISVPRVSSVALKQTHWKNVSITYEIGRIDYP